MYIHLEDDVIEKEEFCEGMECYIQELSENKKSSIQIPLATYSTGATILY